LSSNEGLKGVNALDERQEDKGMGLLWKRLAVDDVQVVSRKSFLGTNDCTAERWGINRKSDREATDWKGR